MKITHELYPQLISLDNLFQAWGQFKKGKRKKADVAEFERHLEDNLFALHRKLVNKSYRHGNYRGFYITDPKLRHIHKASVRDRIVHHALFSLLSPIFEPTFMSDSYSCRKGYGTHKGFRKLIEYSRKVSKNYRRNCWILKSDMKKYFDTVDHATLFRIIEKRIHDTDLLSLIQEVIKSYHAAFGKGMPIGNLTSQLFANIYLNELDQFVKHTLRVVYYLRYADDFVILHSNKNMLQIYLYEIELFLQKQLQLELHPRKTALRKLSWGIDFLGYVVLPHYSIVRAKTKKRIFRRVKQNIQFYHQGRMDRQRLEQSFSSYFGIFKHTHAYKLDQALRNSIFFWMSNK